MPYNVLTGIAVFYVLSSLDSKVGQYFNIIITIKHYLYQFKIFAPAHDTVGIWIMSYNGLNIARACTNLMILIPSYIPCKSYSLL